MKKWFIEHEDFAFRMVMIAVTIIVAVLMICNFESNEFIINAEALVGTTNVEVGKEMTELAERLFVEYHG